MLIEQDPRFRQVPAELLLSPEHSQFTSDIFLDLGGPSFKYYLHRLSGPVEIGVESLEARSSIRLGHRLNSLILWFLLLAV